jgi:hypothetical protein
MKSNTNSLFRCYTFTPPNLATLGGFQTIRPLAKVELRPPILGGEYIQSPPELADLRGIPAFMQEVYSKSPRIGGFRGLINLKPNPRNLCVHGIHN